MREPNIFIIADTHLFHKNIINYCGRPFENVEEMNNTIIKNWNRVVGKHDIVYVLGDFALCGRDSMIDIARQLNGRKRLILGNHDGASIEAYKTVFEYVYNHPIILDDFFILSHYPQFITPGALYANIYGHVHNDISYRDYTSRTFCACAERPLMNYTPIEFETIKAYMKEAEENGEESNN